MWYYTRHKLTIDDVPKSKEKTNQEIYEEIKEDDNMWYCFDWLDSLWEKVKGYNLEENMKEYSKKYPNKIFRIYWEWEENWDMWEEVFINGKSKREVAEIQIKKIDISELI